MKAGDVLSSDPEIVSGAVVFKGTRVPAEALFDYLAAGDPIGVFLEDFPSVSRGQVEEVLMLASDDLKQVVGKRAA